MSVLSRVLYMTAAAALVAVLAVPATAGTWQVSVVSTNSQSSSSSPSTQAMSYALSGKTMAIAYASVFGQTGSALYAQAQAANSGTWTFTWQPTSSSDWPSACTIQSISQRGYKAFCKGGTGTAHVYVTGGADLVTSTLPNTASPVLDAPVPTVQVDTSDPNLTITTSTSSLHTIQGLTGAWWERRIDTVGVTRAYAAAWFPAHFATPSAITITFTVSNTDVTARVDFTGSASDSAAAASAIVSDIYTVQ